MTAIGHTGKQKLDRAFQRELLLRLADYYPHAHVGRWEELHPDQATVKVNLHYLMQHGLIEAEAPIEKRFGGGFVYGHSKITHKGLDFLEADGGLSAILGVQVIRLHDDTIRALLEEKIQNSALPEAEKNVLIQGVKDIPAEGLKHLTMKLLDAGWENAPNAWKWVSSILENIK